MSDQQKPTSGPVASAEEAPVANGDSSSGPEARSITATLGDADQQAKTALRDQQVAVAIDKAIQDSKTSSIPDTVLSHEELSDLHSSREFIQLLRSKELSVGKIKRVIKYENDLESLQIELVKMQRWIQETG